MQSLLLLVVLAIAMPVQAQTPVDVEVSPPDIKLKLGEKIEVAATGYTESGDILQKAAYHWSSTDSTVVRVQGDSNSDVITLVALQPGAAVVEARSGKGRGFTTVEVAAAAAVAPAVANAPDPLSPPGQKVESPETIEAKRRIAACGDLLKLPPAGAWVQWQSSRGTLKLSVLGTETREDKTFYRVEMETTAEQGKNVVQLLTSSWPNTGGGLAEVVMQSRGRPPVRLTGERLAAMRSRTPSNPARVAASRCRQMVDAGEEQVTVPAGTFTARHFHDAEGDYQSWIDAAIPFGLIKATSKTGGDVLLVASGTGATTGITGTPPENPMRGRGRGGRPPS